MTVPGKGNINARIMVVGEAPSDSEVSEGAPFVGPAGRVLNNQLQSAGLYRSDLYIDNAINFQPPDNKLYNIWAPKKIKGWEMENGASFIPEVGKWVSNLREKIRLINPNVIVALGNVAQWALIGKPTGITDRAGFIAPSIFPRNDGKPFKVISIEHPSSCLRGSDSYFRSCEYWGRVKMESQSPEIPVPDHILHFQPSFRQAVDFLKSFSPKQLLVSDIETRRRQIACIGFAFSKKEALTIPFLDYDKPGYSYWGREEEFTLITLIRDLITKTLLIGQNFAYDIQYIAKLWGIFAPIHRDTMLTQHTFYPGAPKDLAHLVSLYANVPVYWKGYGDEKEWDSKASSGLELWRYNAQDCCYTFEVSEEQEKEIAKRRLESQILYQGQLWPAVVRMMLRGIRQNTLQSQIMAKELTKAIDKEMAYMKTALGQDVNPNSPKQLQQLFYHDFGIKPVISRKTKTPTTDGDALDVIAKREPLLKPIVTAIANIRSLKVFKSTFVEATLDTDGRMRCSYNQGGTETFRFSSSESAFYTGGNMQNIPTGNKALIGEWIRQGGTPKTKTEIQVYFDWGEKTFVKEIDKELANGTVVHFSNDTYGYGTILPNVRSIYEPDDGYIISEWDLARADLQVVAWEADCKLLKARLEANIDLHTEHSKELHCTRHLAKIWCHATNYGAKAATTARSCGITQHQSEKMKHRYFSMYREILDWHKRVEHQLSSTRTITNKFGFSRFYFDYFIDGLLGQALGWVPQSTVGIVINKGLINVDSNLPYCEILLQTHDSLTIQFPKEKFEQAKIDIPRELSIPIPYDDPLIIPTEGKFSDNNWGLVGELK